MREFLLGLTVVLSSGWFTPVTFFMGIGLGMEAICLQQHCRRTYTPQDIAAFNCTASDLRECADYYAKRRKDPESLKIPPYGLRLAVALPAQGNRVDIVEIDNWFHLKNEEPSATLLLPVTAGRGGDSSHPGYHFSVISNTPTSQTVSVSYLDNVASDFTYETDGTTIRPISSKVTNAGYMFSGFLPALFLALAIRRIALWRRKLLQPRTTDGR